jgi:hypothetical protein
MQDGFEKWGQLMVFNWGVSLVERYGRESEIAKLMIEIQKILRQSLNATYQRDYEAERD